MFIMKQLNNNNNNNEILLNFIKEKCKILENYNSMKDYYHSIENILYELDKETIEYYMIERNNILKILSDKDPELFKEITFFKNYYELSNKFELEDIYPKNKNINLFNNINYDKVLYLSNKDIINNDNNDNNHLDCNNILNILNNYRPEYNYLMKNNPDLNINNDNNNNIKRYLSLTIIGDNNDINKYIKCNNNIIVRNFFNQSIIPDMNKYEKIPKLLKWNLVLNKIFIQYAINKPLVFPLIIKNINLNTYNLYIEKNYTICGLIFKKLENFFINNIDIILIYIIYSNNNNDFVLTD